MSCNLFSFLVMLQMPTTNDIQNGHRKEEDHKLLPKRINSDLILNSSVKKNGTLMRTPTPDYHLKMENGATTTIKNGRDEKAELDSLESFTLNNPSSAPPKPPPNYFVRAPNGTATMKKHGRPVSVTIGEYAGGGPRREPSKLDFLNGDKPDSPHVPQESSISNRLQSELVMTLSRSNLRKKTEALVSFYLAH